VKLAYTTLFALLLIMPACSRDSERVRAAGGDPTQSADAMRQQRSNYVKTIDARLAEFDQKVDGLQAREKAMKGTDKKVFDDAVTGLKDQRTTVGKKLDDLRNVSIESWLALQTEVDGAVSDLERSYEHVSASHEPTPATTRR